MAYILSAQAEQDVRDVYDYGHSRFGDRQAMEYFDRLHSAFDRIDLTPMASRLRAEFDPPIRVHTFQAHVILYAIQDADVYIYRVFHGAADWHSVFSAEG